MGFVKSFLILLATVSSSLVASAAAIPSFQVGGTTSSSNWSLALVPTPDNLYVAVTFDPATWTVSQLYDAGNSGLGLGDSITFAGGSVTAVWNYDGSYYLNFVKKDLAIFTTAEGTFSFDSQYLGLYPYYNKNENVYFFDPSNPAYSISDSELVAYATGTINGPGGSRSADLMIFANLFGGATQLDFGNVAWAIYAPAVLPVLPAQVPEPTSMAIFGLGALGIAFRARRKAKA